VLVVDVICVVGCPPARVPAPQAVPITVEGRTEAEGEWQVHTVRLADPAQDPREGPGTPVQAALVAWIGSWQNLELVSFEVVTEPNAVSGKDLVIVARRRGGR